MANTTSSSYSFDQNFSIDEIIADAYERIGLVGTAGHQIKTARKEHPEWLTDIKGFAQ